MNPKEHSESRVTIVGAIGSNDGMRGLEKSLALEVATYLEVEVFSNKNQAGGRSL